MTFSSKASEATRPIVFLDIDGVIALNAGPYSGWDVFKAFESQSVSAELLALVFDSHSIENLKALHAEFNPIYVISSSWRRELTVDQFRVMFERAGMLFVGTNLHPVWCTSTEGIPNRPREINQWLSHHGCGAPFLIIDDADSGKDFNDHNLSVAGYVHLCVPRRGYTRDCLINSQTLLRMQVGNVTCSLSMRPVVFLDLDDVLVARGVFNSYQVIQLFDLNKVNEWQELWDGLIHSDARMNLQSLDSEFSPRYVISSSWTTHLTQEQMITVFERTNLDFVALNLHTEWTTPKRNGYSRKEEIEAWLVNHHKDEAVLVLDDYCSGTSLLESQMQREGKVVLCQANECFAIESLDEARRVLHAQENFGPEKN